MAEMVINSTLAVSAGLLVIYLWVKWCGERKMRREQQVIDLNEVVRTAELINNSFFHSLDLVQRNIESLLVRAGGAEQSLRMLLPKAEIEKMDQYATASLFLEKGKDVKEISQTLKLSLAQVQLIQELRQGVKVENEKKDVDRTVRRDIDTASGKKSSARQDLAKAFDTTGEHRAAYQEKVAEWQIGGGR